jgi:hypothetical protein
MASRSFRRDCDEETSSRMREKQRERAQLLEALQKQGKTYGLVIPFTTIKSELDHVAT